MVNAKDIKNGFLGITAICSVEACNQPSTEDNLFKNEPIKIIKKFEETGIFAAENKRLTLQWLNNEDDFEIYKCNQFTKLEKDKSYIADGYIKGEDLIIIKFEEIKDKFINPELVDLPKSYRSRDPNRRNILNKILNSETQKTSWELER